MAGGCVVGEAGCNHGELQGGRGRWFGGAPRMVGTAQLAMQSKCCSSKGALTSRICQQHDGDTAGRPELARAQPISAKTVFAVRRGPRRPCFPGGRGQETYLQPAPRAAPVAADARRCRAGHEQAEAGQAEQQEGQLREGRRSETPPAVFAGLGPPGTGSCWHPPRRTAHPAAPMRDLVRDTGEAAVAPCTQTLWREQGAAGSPGPGLMQPQERPSTCASDGCSCRVLGRAEPLLRARDRMLSKGLKETCPRAGQPRRAPGDPSR